ncbi:MAG TPA: phenylalanine--tRNA ligase subunit beta [Trueperaceae bacterium]|nr:phenylalanine--tRNA ligase subunit beta [Trueperaceae bacterium]
MRVPHGWLAEFLGDALPDVETTVQLLDGLGLAVETVHALPAAPAGVIVADLVEVEPIEGSEHLVRAVASDGERRVQVVCGAPNARVGVRSALALPGAELPGAGFTVAAREMLGVASNGVLASPRELGIFDYGGGIATFGPDVPPGSELARLWPAESVIELELTPNRGDAFSLLGVARDLAAKLGAPVRVPGDGDAQGDSSVDDGLRLEIDDPAACPRFTLRLIEGVTVGPSPLWLQRRLAALGLRPRNNVVDVTNYVTFELGQPSHAYDRRVLEGGVLQVRRARDGERVTLLDEEERTLVPDDLVIATPDGAGGSRAVGLAGVMGGLHDSVVGDTRDVALEVAHFDPVAVRKAAKRHRLSTDAHYRFERGVDPNLPPLASARAAALIAQTAGGRLHPGLSATGSDVVRRAIAYHPSRVAYLMAMDVPVGEQRSSLEALGCGVSEEREDAWRVTPPSWRFDLSIEEDLVEEVSRLHGYEHIGKTVPAMHFVPPIGDPTHRWLREAVAAMGLQETVSYVFTGPDALARAAAPGASVTLSNPQGAERSVLRTALYPGLLAAAAQNRDEPALALFEVGHVFLEGAEEERLAMLWRGPYARGVWREDEALDFFVVKGVLERLASRLGAELRCRPGRAPMLHPGVAADVNWEGTPIGVAGQLHPEVAARFELDGVYLAELRLPLEEGRVRFRDFPRQPFAERDLAVVAPVDVSYAHLHGIVRRAAGDELESVEPFDVYQGEQVGAGNRSVALRLRFRRRERALTDEEVDGRMRNVMSAVRDAGYDIRA